VIKTAVIFFGIFITNGYSYLESVGAEWIPTTASPLAKPSCTYYTRWLIQQKGLLGRSNKDQFTDIFFSQKVFFVLEQFLQVYRF
jgi:hypothetical protein